MSEGSSTLHLHPIATCREIMPYLKGELLQCPNLPLHACCQWQCSFFVFFSFFSLFARQTATALGASGGGISNLLLLIDRPACAIVLTGFVIGIFAAFVRHFFLFWYVCCSFPPIENQLQMHHAHQSTGNRVQETLAMDTLIFGERCRVILSFARILPENLACNQRDKHLGQRNPYFWQLNFYFRD